MSQCEPLLSPGATESTTLYGFSVRSEVVTPVSRHTNNYLVFLRGRPRGPLGKPSPPDTYPKEP